jgi:hypothetical protein
VTAGFIEACIHRPLPRSSVGIEKSCAGIDARLKFVSIPADKVRTMGTQAQGAAPEKKPVPYVARQPILAADEKVLGYELLFQQGQAEDNLIVSDTESVTCAIIDTLNVIGLGVLCDGRSAFIDCTHQMLLMEYFALLPPKVVVEIQNSVPADDAVVAVCQRLKEGGYLIALDDFVPSDPREALVPFADFIKIDIKKVLRPRVPRWLPVTATKLAECWRKKSKPGRTLPPPRKADLQNFRVTSFVTPST